MNITLDIYPNTFEALVEKKFKEKFPNKQFIVINHLNSKTGKYWGQVYIDDIKMNSGWYSDTLPHPLNTDVREERATVIVNGIESELNNK